MQFAKFNGISGQPCTPKHLQANGLVRKLMSSIVKLVHASLGETRDSKVEIHRFLMNYGSMTHPAMGQMPSRSLMGRIIKTKIPVSQHELTGEERVKEQLQNNRKKPTHMQTRAEGLRRERCIGAWRQPDANCRRENNDQTNI